MTKIAAQEIDVFKKGEIALELNEGEKGVFTNFITKFKDAGIIKSGENRGEYEFANYFYRAFIKMRFASAETGKETN